MPNDYEQIDAESANKVKILEQIKDKAVQNENFDQAKQIRDQIERIRSIGIHLNQLSERKNMATANEDYDAAKIIKNEMEKLKQAAYSPWVEELIQNFLGG